MSDGELDHFLQEPIHRIPNFLWSKGSDGARPFDNAGLDQFYRSPSTASRE
ncbi:MAG: hypothetical protein R3B93_07320 [Bacteroidia bacterium]